MKKVLLISYYWPPAGGPGALRVVKFARYLPHFGWQPVVLTVQKGEFPYLDPSLEKDLPPEVRVYRSQSWDPFSFYKKFTGKKSDESIPVGVLIQRRKSLKEKLAGWIRANLFVPDARIGWIPFALKKARQIIEAEGIDLIFVSSPPHSSQLIGRKLHKATGLPWVADLRDPWTDIRYYEYVKRTAFTRRLDAYLERKVVEETDAITTVSNDLVRLFLGKSSGDLSAKFLVLPNGYDEEDFSGLKYRAGEQFTILHTGNMQEHQNPEVLWQTLGRLLGQNPELRGRVRVRLVGRTHPAVLQSARESGVAELVETLAFRPHREVLPMMKNADLLLMVIPRVANNRGIVTGKLFEYFGAERPILVIGPPQSDAGELLKPLKGSRIVDYEDTENLAAFLQKALRLWQAGSGSLDNGKYIVQFSRRSLTKKLAALFNRLSP